MKTYKVINAKDIYLLEDKINKAAKLGYTVDKFGFSSTLPPNSSWDRENFVVIMVKDS